MSIFVIRHLHNILYLPVLPFFVLEPALHTLGQALAVGDGESKRLSASQY